MLYICVSFDYELFLGENFLPEEDVLFKPSEKIGNMLSLLGISATFFADVCCPMCYRRLGDDKFPKLFDEQLRTLTRQGHDIQLHIHPSWLCTTEIGRKVVFDHYFYRIHHWADGEDYNKVGHIIHEGVEYLNSVLLPVKNDYRCIAFRAGGYCLQPEEKLVPILYNEGIRIDSSICRGLFHDGDGMYYDYKKRPKVNNFYMNEQYGIRDEKLDPIEKGVFEVPVGGFSSFPFRPIASRLNAQISNNHAKGTGMQLILKKTSWLDKLFNKFKVFLCGTNMLTFDFYNDKSMLYMLRRMARENRIKCDTYVTIISHPKVHADEHIENMKKVLSSLKSDKRISFVSMSKIAEMLKF